MALGCSPETNLDPNCSGQPVEDLILRNDHQLDTGRAEDDAGFDSLCAGNPHTVLPYVNPAFPITESFEHATFDTGNPNWTLQGTAHLTAGVEDPPLGPGRLRLSNAGAFTNGAAIYNPTFSNADNTITEVNWASYGGTNPSGDGYMQFFSDGSQPPQNNPLGGGGSLGLGNIDYGYVAVVLDEFGGSGPPGGFNFNRIKVRCLCPTNDAPPACAGPQVLSVPVNPNTLYNHPRSNEISVKTALVTEAGQTYISVWIDWTGMKSNYTQYINKFNLTPSCGVAPASLRTGFSASSGGAYHSIHELHGLNVNQGGVAAWRSLSLTNDVNIPDCAFELALDTCVQVVLDSTTELGTGNTEPEFHYWLVNEATNTILTRADLTTTGSGDIGVPHQLCLNYTVQKADLPDLRLYMGADRRDATGEYGSTWSQLSLNLASRACPCPSCSFANVGETNAELHGCAVNPVPTNAFLRFAVADSPCSPFVATYTTTLQAGTNAPGQCIVDNVLGLDPDTQYCFRLEVVDPDGTTVSGASDPCSFRTVPILPLCDPATNITQTSATLHGHTDMDIDDPTKSYVFKWREGNAGPYTSSSPMIPTEATNPDTDITYNTGDVLKPGTQYCYTIVLVDETTQHEYQGIPFQCGLTPVNNVNPSCAGGCAGYVGGAATPPYTPDNTTSPLLEFSNCGSNRICAFGITMDASTGADAFDYGLLFLFDDRNGAQQALNGFISTALYSPPINFGPIAPGTYTANINGTNVTVTFTGNDWRYLPDGTWGRSSDSSGNSDDIFIGFSPPVRNVTVSTNWAVSNPLNGTLSNSRIACSTPVGISNCCFTTDPAAEWCGGWYDPDNCILVDPGNGDPPYYYCALF